MAEDYYVVYDIKTGQPVYLRHFVDVKEHIKSRRFTMEAPSNATKEAKEKAKKTAQLIEEVQNKETLEVPPLPKVDEIEIQEKAEEVSVEEVPVVKTTGKSQRTK